MFLPLACKGILALLEYALGREVISQRQEERILREEFDSSQKNFINSVGMVIYENVLSIQSISFLPLLF